MNANSRTSAVHFLRQPLLHFVVIGAVVGAIAIRRGESPTETDDRTVRVSAVEVERTRAEWESRWKRPPTAQELSGVIAAQVRETILYREALAMGLDRNNPVIKRLLAREVENMTRELVELSLSPTDQDLAEFFEGQADTYRPEPLITFTHIFVDPDRRGDRTLDDAAQMLAELGALEPSSEIAQKMGDQFMLQRYYPEKPASRISSLFGREFTASIFELEAGRWHGPVLSGYGTHLVYVERVNEAPVPALEDVKERVTEDWVAARRTEITDKYFADTMARYEVLIDGVPSSSDGDGEPGSDE